ncbi:Pol protein [Phytophthora palmivora]|uniref:Pol protein n=1 Tax=Phytophthora palmivora TaxID=4796 RepID=A0A2P4X303_9STRA|nr:Pol protein [Phytophthora palmivora]
MCQFWLCRARRNLLASSVVTLYNRLGREHVISFQSRQLKTAERDYPVHDKELLAMKNALTVTNSPHLSQRMAMWLSFLTEYNFRVGYKPSKLNMLVDALAR